MSHARCALLPASVLLLLALLAGTHMQTAGAAGTEAWRKQVLYFTLTDRFGQAPGKTAAGCKLTDFNNGTWSGITSRLDYLEDLGMTAIWITPIVQQIAGRYGDESGYHGYWAGDWTRVEPHYGSEADLKQLLRAAKQRGMLTMLDVVANHVGPVGVDFSRIRPFNSATHYHACRAPCDDKCNIPQAAYEPGAPNAAAVMICRLAELPDLNQSVPYVRQQLLGWLERTLAADRFPFDGLRVDTLKHVDNDFWREYTAVAKRFTLGEWYNIDTRSMPGYISGPRPPVNSLLNFPLFYALTDAFARQRDMRRLQQERALQHAVLGRAGVGKLGIFLDNHDVPRFLSLQPDVQLLRNALTWLLMADGIPIVYSGTEQGFTGLVSHGENRNCLWTSGYNRASELYQTISRLAKFRTQQQLWTVPEVALAVTSDCYVYARGSDVLVVTTNRGSSKGMGTCSAVLPRNVTLLDGGAAGVQDVLQPPRAAGQAAAGLSWNPATRRLSVSLPNGAPRVLTSRQSSKAVQELDDGTGGLAAHGGGGDEQHAAVIRDAGAAAAAVSTSSSSIRSCRESGSMLALAAAAVVVLMLGL